MSDFTDFLVTMNDAIEELVQTEEMFVSIFDVYQRGSPHQCRFFVNLKVI